MLLSLSQAAVPTARNCSINLKLSSSNPPLTSDSHKKSKFIVKTIHPRRRALSLTLAKADGSVDSNNSAAATSNLTSRSFQDETVSVGQGNVPLEGVIQFEKPDFSSRINKWGWYGDISVAWLCLLAGMCWRCFCSLQLEGLIMASQSLTLILCVLLILLLLGGS
ncbi:hypothetical protein CISIN_1g023715mg [Citrus sinensis]|uniref:Uncharacterized protein n=1 Tax=Citrus sinensis TaxID=2711 RepID=A0A067GNZ8_CITSI|nr:hypothetical protein CISIN_1g023715mg [Citrus sinensis]